MKPLLVRADAGTRMGTGHVMRCLALAQAWQDCGGAVSFAMASHVPSLADRLVRESIEVVGVEVPAGSDDDAAQTAEHARRLGAGCIVVDGYHFGAGYQRRLKDAGPGLAVIDDSGHAGRYVADIVLNQNLHANEGMYKDRAPHTTLMLGAKCVLLRREFRRRRGWARTILPKAERVLVTLGGSDPENHSCKVLAALDVMDPPPKEVIVIAGAGNLRADDLVRQAAASVGRVRVLRNVSDMSEIMSGVDMAISSGGSTVWELAFMGLPAIVGRISPVEDLLIGGLKEIGLFVDVGWFVGATIKQIAAVAGAHARDFDQRSRMSDLGRRTIDGNGCDRVVKAISAIC